MLPKRSNWYIDIIRRKENLNPKEPKNQPSPAPHPSKDRQGAGEKGRGGEKRQILTPA